MYARIIDNKCEIGLPASGTLSDGTWVTGYNLLPNSKLALEGWRSYVEDKPTYDDTTQRLVHGTAYELDGTIHMPYTVETLPAAVPTQEEKNAADIAYLAMMTGVDL